MSCHGNHVGAGPQTRPSQNAAHRPKNVHAGGDFQPQRTQRTQRKILSSRPGNRVNLHNPLNRVHTLTHHSPLYQ